METHVDEEGPRLSGLSEEDLATLVEHKCLVEEVVGSLRRLVDGNTGSGAVDLGFHAEGFTELDGVCGVETSGGVIPGLQWRSAEGSFSDSDTLSLSSRYTTEEVVTNTGVDSVRNSVQGHDDIALVLSKLLYTDATRDVPWATCLSSKVKSLSNGHHGEMNIDFGSVDGFTTVVLVHELWADTWS